MTFIVSDFADIPDDCPCWWSGDGETGIWDLTRSEPFCMFHGTAAA